MNCTLVTLHFAVAAAASRTLKLWTPDSELHLPGIDREEDGRILIENGLQSSSTAISGKRNDETGEEQETRDNWIQHLCSIEYDRHVWHGSSQPLSTFCKVEIDFGWFWSQLLIYVGLWMVYESWEMGCIVLSAFQINLHSQQSKNWPEDLETAGLADPVWEQDTTTTSNWFQLILDFALQTETVLIGIVINFHQSLSIVQGSGPSLASCKGWKKPGRPRPKIAGLVLTQGTSIMQMQMHGKACRCGIIGIIGIMSRQMGKRTSRTANVLA